MGSAAVMAITKRSISSIPDRRPTVLTPLKPDDRMLPGSERAYDAVNDRLIRDIVKDFAHGPARLPSVHPQDQAPRGSGWTEQPTLKPPSGIELIDRMCLAADQQERLAKIEALARTVASLQAAHDAEIAEIKRLEAEVVRRKEEVKKAEAAKPKS
jgi:hypothetical protein